LFVFFAGDNNKVFITRSLNITPKTTEWRLIVHRGKEAEVTVKKDHGQGTVLLN